MTLAIVIARQNDFVVIADSRTEAAHPDFPRDKNKCLYHDQAQKIFHSSTQRIGQVS